MASGLQSDALLQLKNHLRYTMWKFLAFWLLGMGANAWASTLVIYPREVIPHDPHWEYPVRLLELGLKKSGIDYQLRPSNRAGILQGRAILALERGDPEVTLLWTMTDKEREAKLLPIRIPIYKGLIGWRIPIVRASDKDRFKHIKTKEDLLRYTAGQGHDWPDTPILRSNGFQVKTSSYYDGLFSMLALGRFDFFPRSMAEIWGEVATSKTPGLVVEPHIVLHYPAAFYYFVSKRNPQLARDLERGLNLAIADGSFDALFQEYHGDTIARAGIKGRTIIRLAPPRLPPETPLQRRELWLNPERP
ncbi:MAG: hypothetical protein CFE44_12880 [Burkholderiales bacterium PBB4]|nr:MAG: hypothetical protein CFE44_12880 [Burkholderiales bacterium PBB4]